MRRRFAPNVAALYGSAAASLADPTAVIAMVNTKSDGGFWNFQDPSHLWKDTAGTSAVAVAGTDAIARVDDLSAFARPLLQATLANRPIWNKSGSRAYGAFTATGSAATSSWMRPGSNSAIQAVHTHFVVLRPQGAASAWFIGSYSVNSTNLYLWDQPNGRIDMYNGTDFFSANGSVPVNTVTRMVLEANGATSRLFINNVQDGVARPSGALATGHMTLGNDGALTSAYWNGDILAVGWFVGTASAGDLTTLETFMAQL